MVFNFLFLIGRKVAANQRTSSKTFLMPRSTIPSSSLFSDLKPRLKIKLSVVRDFRSNDPKIEIFGKLTQVFETSKFSKNHYLILETRFDSSDIFPFILVDLRIRFFGLDFELESLD